MSKTVTLKELCIWYDAVCARIIEMEYPQLSYYESQLQYNEERAKERLEKVKQSEEYKKLVELKETLGNIQFSIDIDIA